MSVPVSRRGISSMEFYNTAVQLRVELSRWLLRDFGIKDKTRRASVVAKAARMDEEDKETILGILAKYRLTEQLTEEYPDWWLAERRRAVDRLCTQIVVHIRAANAIYPTSEEEYWDRRTMQNKAIGYTEALMEELQFIVAMLFKTLGVDVEKYMPFVDMVDKELALLKGWRKSDNKLLRAIQSKKLTKREKLVKNLKEKVAARTEY
ncbi:MAG: hypothetical protein IKJ34_01960 [Mailhella sp.]|nr:hypothetical protein [Mailhella sp.]